MAKFKSTSLYQLARTLLPGRSAPSTRGRTLTEERQPDDASSVLPLLQPAEDSSVQEDNAGDHPSGSLQQDTPDESLETQADGHNFDPPDGPDTSVLLWNRAYNSLKRKNCDLVIILEEVLTKYILEGDKNVLDDQAANPATRTNLFDRYSGVSRFELMKQAVDKSLNKSQAHESIENNVQDVTNLAKDLQTIGNSILSSYPPAAMALSGVCAILPILVRPIEAKQAMVEGLNHIISRMTWYKDLSNAIIDDTWEGSPQLANLKTSIEKKIVSLYESMLQYQMESVAHCHSEHPMAQNLKTMVRPNDWKNRTGSLKDLEKELETQLSQYSSQQDTEIFLQMAQDNQTTLKHWQEQFSQKKLRERATLMGQFKTTAYEQHMKFNPARVQGTCDWFRNHDKFGHFQKQTHGVLLFSAGPGYGKSVLARHLVEDVLPYSKPSAIVCYFFFKDSHGQRSLSNALCSLIHRIFYQASDLIDHCKDQILGAGQNLPHDSTTLWRIFETAVTNVKKKQVICVLDGLNELDSVERRQFIRFLQPFSRSSFINPTSVKFLITTRGYPEILDEFHELLPTHTLVSGDDVEERSSIQKDVNKATNYRLRKLYSRESLAQDRQDLIQRALHGPYNEPKTHLWASLMLDVLEQNFEDTPEKWSKLLAYTPKTVSQAYESLLQRTGKEDKERLKILFHLVIAAERPLTLREIKIAMHVRDQDGAYSEEDLGLPSDQKFQKWVASACRFFLTEFNGKIYFIHRTARDFLLKQDYDELELEQEIRADAKWEGSMTISQAHRSMAESCIAYLSLRALRDPKFTEATKVFNGGLKETQRRFLMGAVWSEEFLDTAYSGLLGFIDKCNLGLSSYAVYALQHWLSHFQVAQEWVQNTVVRDISPKFDNRYFSLFDEEAQITSPWLVMAAQIAEEDCGYQLTEFYKVENTYYVRCHSSVNSISLASLFGHDRLMRRLLQESALAEDKEPPTDTNTSSGDGPVIPAPETKYQALFFAAGTGQSDCLKSILNEANLSEAKDSLQRTPLHQAARLGRYNCLELLASHFDVTDQDERGWTALDYLTHRIGGVGDLDIGSDIVRQLVSKRALGSPQGGGRFSLLALAAKRRNEVSQDLQRLKRRYPLESLDDPDVITKILDSGLFRRAYADTFIKFLVDHGEDLNFREPSGYTPLHHACKGNFWNAMFLLHAGADKDLTDESGLSPLHVASHCDPNVSVALVSGLLAVGASPNIPDVEGTTPFLLAISHPQEVGDTLTKLMLTHGADIETPDGNGQAPLDRARESDYPSRVEMIEEWAQERTSSDFEVISPLTSPVSDHDQGRP